MFSNGDCSEYMITASAVIQSYGSDISNTDNIVQSTDDTLGNYASPWYQSSGDQNGYPFISSANSVLYAEDGLNDQLTRFQTGGVNDFVNVWISYALFFYCLIATKTSSVSAMCIYFIYIQKQRNILWIKSMRK